MEANPLQVITIENNNNMSLTIINFGATITNLWIPDKNGKRVDVIVGLVTPEAYTNESYLKKNLYLGASIGRYAGRISKGGFKIKENEYKIPHENGVHLHGGNGFDKKYWIVEKVEENAVLLSYQSQDLEEGYPGNVKVSVKYTLTNANELMIEYKAQTDAPTPVNLTSHAYFNLAGKDTVLNHELLINSHQYLEVDMQLVPTGQLIDTIDTVYDRSQKMKLKENNFNGFDTTFILNNEKINAVLYAPESGIELKIITNQPALVVYTPKQFPEAPFTSNFSQTTFPAICFEAQNYPDAPNNSHFPNAILRPNETYLNTTIFQFSIR